MLTLARQLTFARWVLSQRFRRSDASCPYCTYEDSALVGRKRLILQARQCRRCGLIYRYPKAELSQATSYYQQGYDTFEAGLVTTLPDYETLAYLSETNFAGSKWDESGRIALLFEVQPPPARVIDYGCSWGYFLAQAQAAGYQVSGIELSRSRASYGIECLGVDIATDPDWIDRLPAGSVDVIYTSHVLEHLPDLVGVFDRFRRVLVDGGYLIALAPNCGGRSAVVEGVHWGPFINEAHTLALTADFFQDNLSRHGFDVTFPCDLDADELVVLAMAR